jgi:alpha-tubulin suppressor-like RCC1 family protein
MVRVLTLAVLAAGCIEPLQVFTANGNDAGTDAGAPASALSAANAHACAVRSGALYCWGDNSWGQLGTGNQQQHSTPVRVGVDSDWSDVRVGYESSCARKASGSVWCWGDNSHGQLGLGLAFDAGVAVPTQVTLGFAATQLELHFEHVCALSGAGALWCWGMNSEGQLGTNDAAFPEPDHATPQAISAGTQWKQVDTGQGHTCGIQSDGSLWCWGRNSDGQAGQNMGAMIQLHVPTRVGTETQWAHVNSTQQGSCALKTDGSMWCWGYLYDQPISAMNTVQYGPKQIGTRTDWAQIAMETFSLCARDTSAHVWCMGRNVEGELGVGDFNDTRYGLPVEIDMQTWQLGAMGRMFRCAIATDGRVLCTGDNMAGDLGVGDMMRRDVLTPLTFP